MTTLRGNVIVTALWDTVLRRVIIDWLRLRLTVHVRAVVVDYLRWR
jgi:hypothetical protein